MWGNRHSNLGLGTACTRAPAGPGAAGPKAALAIYFRCQSGDKVCRLIVGRALVFSQNDGPKLTLLHGGDKEQGSAALGVAEGSKHNRWDRRGVLLILGETLVLDVFVLV